MAMSKKHYDAIASAFRKVMNDPAVNDSKATLLAIAACISQIAIVLADDNRAFDKRRFYSASIDRLNHDRAFAELYGDKRDQ